MSLPSELTVGKLPEAFTVDDVIALVEKGNEKEMYDNYGVIFKRVPIDAPFKEELFDRFRKSDSSHCKYMLVMLTPLQEETRIIDMKKLHENMFAMEYLGQHYFWKDKFEEAFEYLEKAIALKSNRAQFYMGLMYTNGKFFGIDTEGAEKFLKASVDYEYRAIYNLAKIYLTENQKLFNADKGAMYMFRSIEVFSSKEDKKGCMEKIRKVMHDIKIKELLEVSRQKYSTTVIPLDSEFIKVYDIEEKKKQQEVFEKKIASKTPEQDVEVKYLVELIIKGTESDLVEMTIPDDEVVKHYLRIELEKHKENANCESVLVLINSNEDYTNIVSGLEKLCKQKHTYSMILTGMAFNHRQSYGKSREYFEEAAILGSSFAKYQLATYHKYGQGVERNARISEQLYQASDHPSASYEIAGLYMDKESNIYNPSKGLQIMTESYYLSETEKERDKHIKHILHYCGSQIESEKLLLRRQIDAERRIFDYIARKSRETNDKLSEMMKMIETITTVKKVE